MAGTRYRVRGLKIWSDRDAVYKHSGDRKDSNVALKVINIHRNDQELNILRHLRQSDVARQNESHPGRKAVIERFDDFELGPKHHCLVLEIMGVDAQALIDSQRTSRLKRETAQNIARRTVEGMDYIWKCGVAHGGSL